MEDADRVTLDVCPWTGSVGRNSPRRKELRRTLKDVFTGIVDVSPSKNKKGKIRNVRIKEHVVNNTSDLEGSDTTYPYHSCL